MSNRSVTEATGGNLAPYSGMALAALGGNEDLARSLISRHHHGGRCPRRRHRDSRRPLDERAAAQRPGQYPEAMAAAQQALHHQHYPDARYPGVANWAVAELIEAAALSGATDTAVEAFRWIAE